MPKGVCFVGVRLRPAASTALTEELAANRCCLDQVRWLVELRSAL
jgi:hypothetical protein